MTRSGRWLALARCTAWASSLVWITSGLAFGQGPPRVRVDGAEADTVVRRLVSELRSLGFVVIAEAQTVPGEPRIQSGERIDAVLQVSRSAGVRVWWNDGAGIFVPGGQAVFGDRQGGDPEVDAIRVAEVVRARLLPIERRSSIQPAADVSTSPPAPPTSRLGESSARGPEVREDLSPASVPVTVAPADSLSVSLRPSATGPTADAHDCVEAAGPNTESTVGVARESLGIDVAGLGILGTGGIPPAIDIGLMPVWRPMSRLTFRAVLAAPVGSPQRIGANEGQASVAEWLVGAGVEWNFLPSVSPWSLSGGAGIAAARVESQGDAAPPYRSANVDAWAILPFVSGTASRRLWSPRVRAMVGVLAGAVEPTITIRFGDRDVASWGPLVVGVTAGLELDAR